MVIIKKLRGRVVMKERQQSNQIDQIETRLTQVSFATPDVNHGFASNALAPFNTNRTHIT